MPDQVSWDSLSCSTWHFDFEYLWIQWLKGRNLALAVAFLNEPVPWFIVVMQKLGIFYIVSGSYWCSNSLVSLIYLISFSSDKAPTWQRAPNHNFRDGANVINTKRSCAISLIPLSRLLGAEKAKLGMLQSQLLNYASISGDLSDWTNFTKE